MDLPEMKLAILASGRGSHLQNIYRACQSGELAASISIVISNNSHAPALEFARSNSIPIQHLSGKTHPDPNLLDLAICQALQQSGAAMVITAGYLKKVGRITLARFPQAVINVHPSLLPRHGGPGMYGLKVHQAVLDAAETETGVTIHYVTDEYDKGKIIDQARIDVLEKDNPAGLAARLLPVEHKLLVNALKELTGSP
ncbi:MAG TPA: phosphoribosylglycinamide formyltransferase [Gammaproteobacteria bacterium]|nr:phosphoribosylglycinamide formyltransferase [Gammaproteobacteria bacterium]HIK69592.1 phosphoribosylglycinamide formyltransferase [Pseudomonadales bacterium]